MDEALAGLQATNLGAMLDALRSNADSCKEQGNRLFGEGDMEGAVEAYTRAIEMSDPFAEGTVVLFSNRAAALTRLGRFDAALVDAEAAVASRPDWAKAHFRRGAALFGARRFADAAAAYDAGLALEPDNEALAQGRAMALATLRQAEVAAAPDSSPLERALAKLAEGPPRAPLPVLVLSGFLGAGKTTLLRRVLANAEGLRCAVIVNDMAELNIDAQLLAGGPGAVSPAAVAVASDSLVALSNGCICCTLRDDLLVEVSRLAAEGRFDYLLIESTGISEPLPVAATFTAQGRGGGSLAQHAPLDSLVTVVDCARFGGDYACGESLLERGAGAHGADGRAVAGLLAAQVECADTVVLNKVDLVSADVADAVEATLRALNPRARLLRAVRADVPIAALLHTGRFDAAAARAAAAEATPGAWEEEEAAALQGRPAAGHTPEADACGIASITLAEPRPFHPGRLWDALLTRHATSALLRSKGFLWLASRPGIAWQWSTAGGAPPEFGPAAQWRADALPRHLWPPPGPEWHAQWGDRAQRLVLIGASAAAHDVAQQLRACLLSDEEMAAGEAGWEAMFSELHSVTWGTKEMTQEELAEAAEAAGLGCGQAAHVHSDACGHAG